MTGWEIEASNLGLLWDFTMNMSTFMGQCSLENDMYMRLEAGSGGTWVLVGWDDQFRISPPSPRAWWNGRFSTLGLPCPAITRNLGNSPVQPPFSRSANPQMLLMLSVCWLPSAPRCLLCNTYKWKHNFVTSQVKRSHMKPTHWPHGTRGSHGSLFGRQERAPCCGQAGNAGNHWERSLGLGRAWGPNHSRLGEKGRILRWYPLVN